MELRYYTEMDIERILQKGLYHGQLSLARHFYQAIHSRQQPLHPDKHR